MPQPFNNAVMTNDGAGLLTRAQVGEVQIEFTKIIIGDGIYTDDEKNQSELEKRKELKSPKQDFGFSAIEIITPKCVLMKAFITNQNPETKEALAEGYYINEMGIYAKEKNGDFSTEILYSIMVTTGDRGDFMPPYNGFNPVQIIQEYYISVNNSAEVTIETNQETIALAEDLLKISYPEYEPAEQITELSSGESIFKTLSKAAKAVIELMKHLNDSDRHTSKTEKEKLDGIEKGANKYVHPEYTYGTAQGDADKTLTFGGTFKVPTVTYDGQGHVTGNGITTMIMPANPADDISIGGVNLIPDSNFSRGTSIFVPGSGATISLIDDSTHGRALKVVTSGTNSGITAYNHFQSAKTIELTTGEKYSYSAYIKADEATSVYMGYQGSGSAKSTKFTVGTNWQIIKVEGELDTADNRSLRFYNSDNKTFYITKIKFERGTQATDWTPALGDMVSNADIVSGRNLLKNSRLIPLISNDAVKIPITTELITENEYTFHRVRNAGTGSNTTDITVFNTIPFTQITESLAGKTVILSHKIRLSRDYDVKVGTVNLYGASSISVSATDQIISLKGGVWHTLRTTATFPENLSAYNGIRYVSYPRLQTCVAGDYVDYRDWKIEFSTDWTPAPEDAVPLAIKLATPITLTIGSIGKTVDCSKNVSWSLAEIGAAAVEKGIFTPTLYFENSGAEVTLPGGNVFVKNGYYRVAGDLVYFSLMISIVGSASGGWSNVAYQVRGLPFASISSGGRVRVHFCSDDALNSNTIAFIYAGGNYISLPAGGTMISTTGRGTIYINGTYVKA